MIKRVLFCASVLLLTTSLLFCGLLRWLPPPTSTFMLYRHYEDIKDGEGFRSIDYRWRGADEISAHALQAVIASEDQQFFNHSGFDLPSIEAAMLNYLDGGRLRGASTISQQVAKNLFLTPSKNFLRKGLEVWFTVLIESFWSKQRILEVYINIAEFGDHIFGIEAASQRYFGIPAKNLNRAQAALLAATLPNPIKFQAMHPSNYLLKRQHWIIRQMSNIGYNMHSSLK